MVHRLLQKALLYDKEMKNHVDMNNMIEIISKCNDCKKMSRKVSDGCEKIFMCLYLKNNSVNVNAIVETFDRISMRLIIPEYNIE